MEAPTAIQARREQSAFCFTWPTLASVRFRFMTCVVLVNALAASMNITGQPLLDPRTVPANISINDAKLIGNYALKISWTDGHDTGLILGTNLQKLLQK